MKISGTSLIPAARPTPAPFHLRSSPWPRSQTISAISTSSIWPRCSARCTGSIHSATAVRQSRAAARARPRQPSAPSVNHTVPVSAARLARVISQRSTAQGSSEQAAKTTAANGV